MQNNKRNQPFLTFAVVGTAGFVVDAAVLYGAIGWLGLGLYSSRVISFLSAATFTWAANRRYSFPDAPQSRPIIQWARFLAANALGGMINFATYSAIVGWTGVGRAWPVLGVAAGSIVGLASNFFASKRWVFR